MTNRTGMITGAIIGLITPLIAFAGWVYLFSDFEIKKAIELVIKGNLYSEVISLSAIANFVVMLILLNRKDYAKGNGVLLATILLSFVVISLKLFS